MRHWPTLRERLEANSIPEPMSGCWLWMGNVRHDGYGTTWLHGRPQGAHRLAWESANGIEVPEGMCICHKCDNKMCVNPDHLFLGTYSENAVDMRKKNKGKRSRIGMPYGVAPHRGKFQAQVGFGGRYYYLGRFDTPEEAHAVAVAKRDELWEEAGL